MIPMEKNLENIVGKGENAGNQHFLLFPQCFLPLSKTVFNFLFKIILLSANFFNSDQPKISPFGKGLTVICSFLIMDLLYGECRIWSAHTLVQTNLALLTSPHYYTGMRMKPKGKIGKWKPNLGGPSF